MRTTGRFVRYHPSAADGFAAGAAARDRRPATPDPTVPGVLIQLPLPEHLDEGAPALLRVNPAKDVDGFHLYNAGSSLRGEDGIRPCTPQGIVRLL